jgi:hypothetical protein
MILTHEIYLHRSHARDELRRMFKRVSDAELDAAAFLLGTGSDEATRASHTLLVEAEKRIERSYPREIFGEERIDVLERSWKGEN